MIDLIKEYFQEGDSIRLTQNDGKIVEGRIKKISSDALALLCEDGKMLLLKTDKIDSFEQCLNTADSTMVSDKKEEKVQVQAEESKPKADAPIEKSSAAPEPKYKPGDKMPIAELEQIDPSTRKGRIPKTKGKMTSLGKGLEALGSLTEKEHEIENEKYVSNLGEIIVLFPERNFGFIRDAATSKQVYFSLNQFVDEPPLNKGDGVVYTKERNDQGERASCVHKQGTVKKLLGLANKLNEKGEYKQAIGVLTHVLAAFPDNFAADKLKTEIEKQHPTYNFKNNSNFSKYSATYARAKRAADTKDYDKALKLYKNAIDADEKVESSIKDVASLYANWYRLTEDESKKSEIRKNALNFLDKYESKLPQNQSAYQHLENIYYSLRDFDNFRRIADELLNNEDFYLSENAEISLLSKKAAAYIHENKKSEAEKLINEILEISPDNSNALKLKEILENADTTNDTENVVLNINFDALQSGLSSYITNTLEDYTEYAGVPPRIIESGQFTDVTLSELRKQIDKAGRARPKIRAQYLLTEAKLMQQLEPNEEIKLRGELAKYCNAMALNHIAANSPMDVIRLFYYESFSLQEKFDSSVRQIVLCLLTHIYNYSELINTNSLSVDDVLGKVFGKSSNFDIKRWETLLQIISNNREVANTITKRLFDDKYLKEESIKALREWGCNLDNNIGWDSYAEQWKKIREKRQADYSKFISSIGALKADNIGDLIDTINYTLVKLKNEANWLTDLDIRRINDIVNYHISNIQQYIKSTGYRNKETNYNSSKAPIVQLMDEIKEGPTKISYEALLPLLERISTLLDESFKAIEEASEPRVSLKLQSQETVVEDDNSINLQIAVLNDQNSSPIKNVHVSIESNNDIKYLKTINEEENASQIIDGGNSLIYRLQIKVSKQVVSDKAAAFKVKCQYQTRMSDQPKEYDDQLTLSLYRTEDFKEIKNPYAPIADGGPVPIDSNMFYGRTEFIDNIVDAIMTSPSKQVIIYGQKRCGKSSVLLHLKEKLNKTGRAFCVFFSIGDIINNISEAAFYHKILTTISDELEILEFDGKKVPDFKVPRIADFKSEDEDNPLNTFTRYMTKFKMVCKATEGWADKNLVVMIDEFTYLYTEIKNERISPSIMKQWKAVTQNERAQFSVVLVGQDVVPSFKKEDYARNAFGVIQDIRLTYLDEESARKLIVEPILDEEKQSRYIGQAVDTILDYTSSNPYYIQIFCSRLVDFMNRNKLIKVTEADVRDVADSFVSGEQALPEEKFDNLIRAGESEDLQEYPDEDILKILRQIAIATKNVAFCDRTDISCFDNHEYEDELIKHLVDREVLKKRGENKYKIQVKLFQQWLINH